MTCTILCMLLLTYTHTNTQTNKNINMSQRLNYNSLEPLGKSLIRHNSSSTTIFTIYVPCMSKENPTKLVKIGKSNFAH